VQRDRRYSFTPVRDRLVASLGTDRIGSDGKVQPVGVPTWAKTLGEHMVTVQRWRRSGLNRDQAERVADALREHPYVLWPEMRDEDLAAAEAELAARLRTCATDGCEKTFELHPMGHQRRYCTATCRERDRRSKMSEAERQRVRDQRKAYYRANRDRILAAQAAERARQRPSVLEAKRRYRREHYRKNRERELARQRQYDATVRAARRRQRSEAA
jgi:hypothetical protein